jgi:type I restriction enzyme S subunit
MEDLGNFSIPYPPLSEQQQIVSYLDTKTQQIDKLVQNKQQKIKLLQEKRTAVINQAVTKGLNPDVEMKDSGVEWIGQIPKGWGLSKLKYCISIRGGQVNPQEPEQLEKILIAPNHIQSKTGVLLYTETAKEQGAESGKYLFETEDVLYSKIRPKLRKVCIAQGDGLCSADMYPIKTDRNFMIPQFLLYTLLGEKFSQYTEERSLRVAMPKVNREDVENYIIALPSVNEQISICEYITSNNNKFDDLISKEQRKIELMKEYRKSLISDAVTGKIDVREAV